MPNRLGLILLVLRLCHGLFRPSHRLRHLVVVDIAVVGRMQGEVEALGVAGLGQQLARSVGIAFLALDPDKVPPQFLGNSARGAGPEKRIKHHITGVGTRQNDPREQ